MIKSSIFFIALMLPIAGVASDKKSCKENLICSDIKKLMSENTHQKYHPKAACDVFLKEYKIDTEGLRDQPKNIKKRYLNINVKWCNKNTGFVFRLNIEKYLMNLLWSSEDVEEKYLDYLEKNPDKNNFIFKL